LSAPLSLAACGSHAPEGETLPPPGSTGDEVDAAMPQTPAPGRPAPGTTPPAPGSDAPARPPAAEAVSRPPDGAAPPSTGDASTTPAGDGSCKGALVCDDFEANMVGRTPATWAAAVGGAAAGTMRVDDMRAFSGTKAVHVTTPAGARGQAFFSRPLPALPDNA